MRAKLPAVEACRSTPARSCAPSGCASRRTSPSTWSSCSPSPTGRRSWGSRAARCCGDHRRRALSFVAIPFFGKLSDRVGRRRVYLGGAIGSVVLAIAFFPLVQTGSLMLIVVAYILVMNIAHDAQYGPQAAFFSEFFSTRVRYSGISISAQFGGVLAGGFAPLIATALVAAAGGAYLHGHLLRRDVRGLGGGRLPRARPSGAPSAGRTRLADARAASEAGSSARAPRPARPTGSVPR